VILDITNFNDKFFCILAFGICALFIIMYQIWYIAKVDVSMNTSQSYHTFCTIVIEYFVDQEKYFYWILLHMYTVICTGSIIMLGIGTMSITYIEHICGILKIARYK